MNTKRDGRQPKDDDTQTVTYTPESRLPGPDQRRPIVSAVQVFDLTFDVRGASQEHFIVLDLDARNRVIERRLVHIGTLTGVEVHPREIFRGAIVNRAASVIFVHNHPSGDPVPSRLDLELTSRLRDIGELHGIAILDHVIVVETGFVSLADRQWT